MDIKFSGIGGAFDVDWGNSSAVVEMKGKNYLIDCGNTVFPRLVRTSWASKIDAVLITHFHDDHVGSLSTFLAYYNKILGLGKLTVYLPNESFRKGLLDLLSYSLGNPQKHANFELLPEGLGIYALDTTGLHIKSMSSFAYCFSDEKSSIAYSGDLGDADVLFDFLLKQKLPQVKVFHEVSFFKMYAHAYYKDLEKHLAQWEIYGYHNNPLKKPEDCKIPLVYDYAQFHIQPFYPE